MDGQTDAQTKRADGWTDQRTHRPIKLNVESRSTRALKDLHEKNEGRGAKRKSWRKERKKNKSKKEKKKKEESL